MKVNDALRLLVIPATFSGVKTTLNLALITGDDGLTLVDAGLPGQSDLILEAISEEGFRTSDVKRIVITHHDVDHIGSLNQLKLKTGAVILAHPLEVPYIEGSISAQKLPPPERLAAMPEIAEALRNLEPVKVDEPIEEGQRVDTAGGVLILDSPGHTVGHISLFLQKTQTLIVGDALASVNGQLRLPSPAVTPDKIRARDSVARFVALDVREVVCYHGGLVRENPMDQIKRILEVG